MRTETTTRTDGVSCKACDKRPRFDGWCGRHAISMREGNTYLGPSYWHRALIDAPAGGRRLLAAHLLTLDPLTRRRARAHMFWVGYPSKEGR